MTQSFEQQPGFQVSESQPLIAVPLEENGRRVVRYFVDEETADRELAQRKAGRDVRHLAGIWALLSAPGFRDIEGGARAKGAKLKAKGGRVVDFSALARLLEPDRARLRREPEAAAQVLVGLIFAGSHPAVVGDAPLQADEIVSVLLDGMRA